MDNIVILYDGSVLGVDGLLLQTRMHDVLVLNGREPMIK